MSVTGRIYVVGIGPGDEQYETLEAISAIQQSDVIVGYTVYTELVRERYPEKEIISTPMKTEKDRCSLCADLAKQGKTVSLICSGDAGVYGMASLMLEVASKEDVKDVVIVPGITAALSGAARIGAPLSHDFCVISLSDLLTPWEVICKRLKAASLGDFAVVIYNPSSKHRPEHLKKACDILMESIEPERICATVRNIGREGETVMLTTLGELRDTHVDMFTTVFIGNSHTVELSGKMVTPRGYKM